MSELKVIAHIRTQFPEKFGIPRQSNLVKQLKGKIVFEEEYRNIDALRGLEGYDYLWLLWKFEVEETEDFRPTVRPPRLGGNERVGVFATRSPFRPNSIGLSSVKLEGIENSKEGPVIYVSGIDMKDNTPIYDIKPYLPYVDSHEEARGGFTENTKDYRIKVDFPSNLLDKITDDCRTEVIELLELDPRPSYHRDEARKYGFTYGKYEIHFVVKDGILKVIDVDNKL